MSKIEKAKNKILAELDIVSKPMSSDSYIELLSDLIEEIKDRKNAALDDLKNESEDG